MSGSALALLVESDHCHGDLDPGPGEERVLGDHDISGPSGPLSVALCDPTNNEKLFCLNKWRDRERKS